MGENMAEKIGRRKRRVAREETRVRLWYFFVGPPHVLGQFDICRAWEKMRGDDTSRDSLWDPPPLF